MLQRTLLEHSIEGDCEMVKVIQQLHWKVVSPSRYELLGDNRVVLYKGKALGWAIVVDGKINGALFETRDECMKVLRFAFTLYKIRKSGIMTTVAFDVAMAKDIIGPNYDELGVNARDKYTRLVGKAA